VENEIAIYLPTLHPAQMRVKREAQRFNVLACGRRWGKTTLAEDLLADVVIDLGQPTGYFAPTYKYLIEFWDGIVKTFAPITARSNATDRRIELVTGGVIECWTMEDKDAGRSRRYRRVIVDEAGMVADLGVRWQEAIRPTLADFRGDGWLMGTPKGRNFFWQTFEWGGDPLRSEWQRWQMPSEANPLLSRDELLAMRAEMPERRAAQELDAAFLEDGGGVFRGVRAASTALPLPVEPGHTYVIGADWARSGDYTVFSVFDATAKRQVWLDRFTDVEYTHQVARLLGLWERYGRPPVYSEANSIGGPIWEALTRAGVKGEALTTTNATKAIWVDALVLALEKASVTLLNDPVQIGELEAFEATRLPSGVMRYAAPEGMHDDTVMAACLGWYGASQPPAWNIGDASTLSSKRKV
jgi:hypothetical protein